MSSVRAPSEDSATVPTATVQTTRDRMNGMRLETEEAGNERIPDLSAEHVAAGPEVFQDKGVAGSQETKDHLLAIEVEAEDAETKRVAKIIATHAAASPEIFQDKGVAGSQETRDHLFAREVEAIDVEGKKRASFPPPHPNPHGEQTMASNSPPNGDGTVTTLSPREEENRNPEQSWEEMGAAVAGQSAVGRTTADPSSAHVGRSTAPPRSLSRSDSERLFLPEATLVSNVALSQVAPEFSVEAAPPAKVYEAEPLQGSARSWQKRAGVGVVVLVVASVTSMVILLQVKSKSPSPALQFSSTSSTNLQSLVPTPRIETPTRSPQTLLQNLPPTQKLTSPPNSLPTQLTSPPTVGGSPLIGILLAPESPRTIAPTYTIGNTKPSVANVGEINTLFTTPTTWHPTVTPTYAGTPSYYANSPPYYGIPTIAGTSRCHQLGRLSVWHFFLVSLTWKSW